MSLRVQSSCICAWLSGFGWLPITVRSEKGERAHLIFEKWPFSDRVKVGVPDPATVGREGGVSQDLVTLSMMKKLNNIKNAENAVSCCGGNLERSAVPKTDLPHNDIVHIPHKVITLTLMYPKRSLQCGNQSNMEYDNRSTTLTQFNCPFSCSI